MGCSGDDSSGSGEGDGFDVIMDTGLILSTCEENCGDIGSDGMASFYLVVLAMATLEFVVLQSSTASQIFPNRSIYSNLRNRFLSLTLYANCREDFSLLICVSCSI